MLPPDVSDLLEHLSQALVRLGPDLRVEWVGPELEGKAGLALRVGESLLEALEGGRGREELERALREGRRYTGHVLTRQLEPLRVQCLPARAPAPPGTWLLLEPARTEEDVAFAQVLREVARELGEAAEVEAVCRTMAAALVRHAQVRRAEVYLSEEEGGLRRVALSDKAGPGSEPTGEAAPERGEGPLALALRLRQPQVGVQRGGGEGVGSLLAAVPLLSPRRTVGLLVLHKEEGLAFSARELELWSAAAGQLAVAVENVRLLHEAQAALRVREEFMSIASHELKTPLTPLMLGLQRMERRLAQAQPVELGTVLKSRRQLERLAGLVNDLLDASRLERGRVALQAEPLELGHLVAEVVDQFRNAFERPFHLEVPRERVWVVGDRDRLEQVLVNLLENAHKYSPEGAPVRVVLEALEGEARLHVEDRGIGIPRADQGRLFQRFARAANASHRNFGGLGLGLFISHSIAQLHGGRLAVVSAEGEGSTFSLSLPRLRASEVWRLPLRVLVLDEDPAQGAEAERLLRAEGYEVLAGREGVEALRQVAHLPVDLVVLSASAPAEQVGLVLSTFAELPRARPVPLLLAGSERPDWGWQGLQLCRRPYEREDLVAAVREALGLTAFSSAG